MHTFIERWKPVIFQYRWQIIASVAGLSLSLLWFVPPVRASVEKGLSYGKVTIVAPSPVVVSPTPDVSKKQQEQLEEVQSQLSVAQGELSLVKLSLLENQEQLRTVLANINATNEALEKRQNEWLTSLKKITAVSVRPTSSSSVEGEQLEEIGDPVSSLININTASLTELDTLPGIGPSFAQRILDYRKTEGLFKTIEDLQKVKGIGESLFGQIKSLIKV